LVEVIFVEKLVGWFLLGSFDFFITYHEFLKNSKSKWFIAVTVLVCVFNFRVQV